MSSQLLGSFIWCELLTTDPHAAEGFYTTVVGWKAAPFGNDGTYTLFMAGERPVAGLMTLPDEAKAQGAPPNWMMYLGTPNVDETAMRISQRGGRVLRQPADIPNGGRFAVVADPFGAAFGIFSPGPNSPMPPETPAVGDFSWFELYTPNPEGAWRFYETVFGWEKTSAMDMGDMGVYQMFGRGGGVPRGGIMKPPPGAPAAWQPYAMVKNAKAAAASAQSRGARIVIGPMEVPGGDWIAQATDPQGAMFAVHSLKSSSTSAASSARKSTATTKKTAKPAAARAAKGKAKPAKKAARKAAPARRRSAAKKSRATTRRTSAKAAKKNRAKKKTATKKTIKPRKK